MEAFSILICMLKVAASQECSERDYHDIVHFMRCIICPMTSRHRAILLHHGYPTHYNPFDHMERIRFCMTLGGDDNESIRYLFSQIDWDDIEENHIA